MDIINNNYGALLVVTGLLSVFYLIKVYEKSNAPIIAFTSFDFENQKIIITNNGKGNAINIKVCPYSIFIDTKDKNPKEIKADFKILGFLASEKEGEINMICAGWEFPYYFAQYKNDTAYFKSRSTPLYIEYKNTKGRRFLTKVIIKQGEFISKHLGPEWFLGKIYRDLIGVLSGYRILLIHRIKYFFSKTT